MARRSRGFLQRDSQRASRCSTRLPISAERHGVENVRIAAQSRRYGWDMVDDSTLVDIE